MRWLKRTAHFYQTTIGRPSRRQKQLLLLETSFLSLLIPSSVYKNADYSFALIAEKQSKFRKNTLEILHKIKTISKGKRILAFSTALLGASLKVIASFLQVNGNKSEGTLP